MGLLIGGPEYGVVAGRETCELAPEISGSFVFQAHCAETHRDQVAVIDKS